MKLVIKTADIEIQYEDEYSMLEDKAKNRIVELLETIHSTQPTNPPIVGTVEEIFNRKK